MASVVHRIKILLIRNTWEKSMIASCHEEELKVNASKILAANQDILMSVFPFIFSLQIKRTQINKRIFKVINLFPYEKRELLRNKLRKGGSQEDEAIQLLSTH